MPVKLTESFGLKICRENHYKQIKAAFCPATYLCPDSWGTQFTLFESLFHRLGKYLHYSFSVLPDKWCLAASHKDFNNLVSFLADLPSKWNFKKKERNRENERRYYQFSVSLHCYGICYDTTVHSGLDPRSLACNLQESILLPRVWSPLIDSQYF